MIDNISVLISTYNGKRYIINQLESIRLQTVAPSEVLIIDDCSTDDTCDVIRRYIKDYNLFNWKLITNEENIGWRRNFFNGLNLVTNEYIFIADQDDIWDYRKIELMIDAMKDSRINLLVSRFDKFRQAEYVVNESEYCNIVDQIEYHEDIMKVPFPGCTYLIKKSYFEKIKKYWNPIFPHDAFIWRFAYIDCGVFCHEDTLFHWRIHTDSSFSKESMENKTVANKTEWLEYAYNMLEALKSYLLDTNRKNSSVYDDVLQYSKWVQLRKKYYNQKRIIDWARIFPYVKCYGGVKRYFLDLFIVIRGK